MNINSLNLGALSATNTDLTSPYNSNNVTPTNVSTIINPNSTSNENFGSNYPDFTKMISASSNKNEEDGDTDDNDVTLEEKMLNDVERLIYSNNSNSNSNSDFDKFSSSKSLNSHSLPQLPVYTFSNCFKNCASKTMSEQEQTSGEASIFDNQSSESLRSMHSASTSSMSSYQKQNKKENKESQKRKIAGLFNDFKLNPYNFHSLETFGRFIRYSLNLKSELVKEIISNPRIQYWIDKNRCHGFVYQTYPRNETKRRVPPVRCELCKFYGHLSHTCSIKELAFKLNNVVLKNGACRCHICGQLGHPAEAGLCPYIACSFCNQNGHWNYMCPNKDNISRTQCFKCQRYGHSTERCPDHWRQFDRISTFEQTPYRDPSETQKPVYCYQCAQKGHYGYNCPDFHRKYFIRDYHQLDTYPVYFFASSSPFIKYSVNFNENDKRIVDYLVNKPIDDRFSNKSVDEDPLEQLEKFQAKVRNENILNMSIFDETHANMPLKEYIRKWSNWVIDFHWIFTLKYFIEFLPTNKLHFFIKNYPSLDNFILHWMWWSYSLNKDLERFTKDPFRAIGSMPWLTYDVCERNLDKMSEQAADTKANKENEKKTENKKLTSKVPKQPSKFFQYNEFTIKTIGSLLFQEEANSSKLNNMGLNQKKLSRSHSYSDQILQSIVDLNKQSDHQHHHQTFQLDQHLDELGSFKETCEYLRMQKKEMTLKMGSLSPESLNQHKMRSKSLSSSNNQIETLNPEDNIKTENDNVFNDELDKTIVYFDIGCCEKDDLERSQSKNESKLEEENQLKKFIEDKLNVKIEKSPTTNNEEPLACSSKPSIFDKFFKSFSTQEETKKQNEDNLNRIIDLLNKTNVVKKSESLVTTTTIIPSTDEQHVDTKLQQADEDIDTQIKILLKIDIPTSSSSSSSSTPDENKLEVQKEQLKCPNNSKSSDQYASAASSSSTSSSSSVSPLLSVTSTSLDDNKTLSNKKDNLLSMSASSKSSPCISINKTHKHKHEHKLNKISPLNKFRQINSQRHNFNSSSKSYSSSNVNKLRESENSIFKSKFKKTNETSKNFMQNNYRQFQHHQQQQQQQQNMPINFGFELNKQWSINLNPQEKLNQHHIININAENRNNNNRNYYQPFMVSNNQFQQVKPHVNSARQSWSDRQREISTESFSNEFSLNSSAQANNFQRNNNLNNTNFNQFNSKSQRNNSTNNFSNSQAGLMTHQTNRTESKHKSYQPSYNYVGNFKENVENRNSMNYNGFNRQQNMNKNEQSATSSSSSASSLNLPSYANMMPLSNILNNDSKENQSKPNTGNNSNGLLQLKQPDSKMNNRNRFSHTSNQSRNQSKNESFLTNPNLDNFKKQENDDMKYKYQQNSNSKQGIMINNANNSINNNRNQYSSMSHMIHSSTYNALGSAFSSSSNNKMMTASQATYSSDALNQVNNNLTHSASSQQAYATPAPLQPYNMNRNENVFNNNYSTSNRTNLKKISNESSLLNQKQLASSSNTTTTFGASTQININQQQKRAKIFYNKK